MAHALVKILVNDDGDTIETPVWHLVNPGLFSGSAATCTGEYFGMGSSGVICETKTVQRGGITCPDCLNYIKAT